jgi:ABC-type polysaccharide transport system permease subunit
MQPPSVQRYVRVVALPAIAQAAITTVVVLAVFTVLTLIFEPIFHLLFTRPTEVDEASLSIVGTALVRCAEAFLAGVAVLFGVGIGACIVMFVYHVCTEIPKSIYGHYSEWASKQRDAFEEGVDKQSS